MIHYQEKIQIISNVKFCDALKNILHHLYQPIIGVQAAALYSVLITEYNTMKEFNLDINQLRLTKLLQLSLEQLNNARIKLEAMGLLNVYVDKNSDEITYCYEVLKPLNPSEFFNKTQFNDLLLTKLESYDYERTKFMFLPRTINLVKWTKVTTDFESVFASKSLSFETTVQETHIVKENNNSSLTLNIVNDDNLLAKKQVEMQNISPYQYLTLLQNYPLQNKDLELLSKLLNHYRLSPEVVNCLIEYVWYKNNKILVVAYLEKIATSLSQQKITTVQQAMLYLKTAYQQSMNKNKLPDQKNVKIVSKTYGHQPKQEWKQGIIPQWLKEDVLYKN